MKRIEPGDPIVILTGAGISKESGLDTFRDAGGVWTRVRLEDVATPEAFERDPDRVHGFYNARRRTLADPAVQPNAAHAALARLERDWPGPVLLVTQNVDDLHERGGSRRLIHMHGQLNRARCLSCGAGRAWPGDLSVDTPCPGCGEAGGMRPDVVWFGEMPLAMAEIEAALAGCQPVRVDRHLRHRLPGRRLRPPGAGRRGPDGRAEPGAGPGLRPVPHPPPRPRDTTWCRSWSRRCWRANSRSADGHCAVIKTSPRRHPAIAEPAEDPASAPARILP